MQKHLLGQPDSLSSIPGSHEVEGENQILNFFLWSADMHNGACMRVFTNTHMHMYTSVQMYIHNYSNIDLENHTSIILYPSLVTLTLGPK